MSIRPLALFNTAMSTPDTSSLLTLLMLRASDLERTVDFYAALGLNFVQEKHGNGPLHYACVLGPLVIEIYPALQGQAEPGNGMLGFSVASMDTALAAIQAMGGKIITPCTPSDRGRRAVGQDPDGRKVELIDIPCA